MDTKKSVQNLAETVHSLLGLKAHFTSSWVKSVCDIIKNLPSDESSTALKPVNLETNDTFDNRNIDVGTATSKLKEELATLTAHINELNLQRRQVLNDFLDLKGNIRVFCRIRPINMGENFNYFRPVIALDSSNILLNFADKKCKTYSFDKVFHPGSSQDEVFSEVEPVIKSALDGYNACIFAYGQTGTGKTFTMEGTPDFPGVVPRVIEALFKQAVDSNHAFLFSFSMLEIYLGNLKDLLIPQPTKTTDPMPPCLSIQTDPKGGIEIDNLVAIQVGDFNQALRLYKLGCQFRSTASTNSNIASSRSHCMIRISITCFDAHERRRETNKIWLIDLGGSERILKTKSWGKRLEEGKAINLSLSALGDVINALQRKKRHVPYRNSKLTQVLKDSLGEDSKTLMLVHVSPKEEDLCETICTLNFATRVRSIHLGNEDSTGVKDQKEVAIMNLQQKMKKIEDERQDVRRDIESLHEKLDDLIGTAPSSSGQLDASLLTSGVLQSSLHIPNNRIKDATAIPLSQLPSFMRPTICSRKKSGVNHQFSEAKPPPLVRRKRSSSHHAKSLTFPVKGNSEYNSDCSISRTSCLVRLNMKSSADTETEYSQDTSECDIKMVLFPAQESSARSSTCQRAHISHSEGYENTKTRTINTTKLPNVNNWLHLHQNESNISSYTRRSKWIQDIPNPEKKNRCHEQNKADKSSAKTAHNYDFTMDRVANQDVTKKLVDMRGVNRPVSELVIDKQPRLLKDFFNKDSLSHSSSRSSTTDGEMRTYTQDLADGSSTEDNGCATVSPPEMCSKLDQNNDDNRDNGMSILHAVNDKSQCSNTFMPRNSEHCHISPSNLDTIIIDRRKDSGVHISLFELKSPRHQVPSEMGSEDCGKEDSDESFEHSAKGTKPGLHKQRSKRALFIVNANQKDLATSFVKLQGNTKNTVWSGMCYLLKQKSEVLCASALLGLGMQNLGFEHDFFHGLML